MTELTNAQRRDLEVARALAGMGVPLFLAPPDPHDRTGFRLPVGWQDAPADPTLVDCWRPGWALGLVTGVVYDLVDVDRYAGGQDPAELPHAYLTALTPSGGTHYFVAPIGVESRNGAYPGVDVKSGTPDGRGRGFAFIAPTAKRSKVDGQTNTYEWTRIGTAYRPDPWDRSGDLLRAHVEALRAHRAPDGPGRRLPRSAARAEWARAVAALSADVAHWARVGWGGAAHDGLLRHTTHLARLSPDHAADAVLAAFAAAGVEPDGDDLAKVESAVSHAVPDEVADDEEFSAQELFWAGAVRDDHDEEARAWRTGWDQTTSRRMAEAARWRRNQEDRTTGRSMS